jgi:guanylate kinase
MLPTRDGFQAATRSSLKPSRRTFGYVQLALMVLSLLYRGACSKTFERNSLIICGPSGVGKGTVIKSLLSKWGEDTLSLSVSHTTRMPRPGEIDGVHYNFVDKHYMQEAVKKPGEFLEYAVVHDNLYGTSRKAVEDIHKSGRICVLDVDTNGVKQMKALDFPGKYVFLTPPSIETLEQRLRNRMTETEAQILRRMQTAREVVEFGEKSGAFDLLIVNHELEKTVSQLNTHLLTWFPNNFNLKDIR